MRSAWKVLLRVASEQQRRHRYRVHESRYGDCAACATQTMVRGPWCPRLAGILRTIMLKFRALVNGLNGLVLGFALLAPGAALALPKDKAATQLRTEAMQTDYAETNFKKAEQKLKKAVGQCGA